jgi:hypothetical protein
VDFKFHCPECGQKMQTTDDMVGSSVDCPICHKQFKVPPPAAAAESRANAPQTIHCAVCRALIPVDSTFCDVCGERQPAPAMPQKPDKQAPVWALPLAILLVLAVTAAVVVPFFLRSRQADDADDAAALEAPPAAVAVTTEVHSVKEMEEDDIVSVEAPPPPVKPPPAKPKVVEPPPPPPPEPAPPAAPSAPDLSSDPTETEAVSEEDAAASELIERFERTREKYKEVLEEIEQSYRERVGQTQVSFVSSLEKLRSAMQEQGNLLGVVKVRDEIEAFQKISYFPPVIRSAGSDYAELAELKKQYNRQLAALKQERDQTIEQRTVQYDKHLAVFERRLTQAGKIDDALNVHAERERVRVKTSR